MSTPTTYCGCSVAAMSLLISPMVSCQPAPMPLAMLVPMPANTVDGLWMPSSFLIQSTKPVKRLDTSALSRCHCSVMPLRIPSTMALPMPATDET